MFAIFCARFVQCSLKTYTTLVIRYSKRGTLRLRSVINIKTSLYMSKHMSKHLLIVSNSIVQVFSHKPFGAKLCIFASGEITSDRSFRTVMLQKFH